MQVVASHGSAQDGAPEDILTLNRVTDLVQKLFAIRKSVWVAHGNIDGVLVIFERHLETERIKRARFLLISRTATFSRRLVLLGVEPVNVISIDLAAHLVIIIVGNVVPVSMPPLLIKIRTFL